MLQCAERAGRHANMQVPQAECVITYVWHAWHANAGTHQLKNGTAEARCRCWWWGKLLRQQHLLVVGKELRSSAG